MGLADILITRGWAQGAWVDRDGAVCLDGAAMVYACGYSDVLGAAMTDAEYEQWDRARRAIAAATGDGVILWNDAPGRTFAEVLRAAKEADEILDAS
jgi:hypothetical protein